jgi:hypothetical protein
LFVCNKINQLNLLINVIREREGLNIILQVFHMYPDLLSIFCTLYKMDSIKFRFYLIALSLLYAMLKLYVYYIHTGIEVF